MTIEMTIEESGPLYTPVSWYSMGIADHPASSMETLTGASRPKIGQKVLPLQSKAITQTALE